MACIYACMPTQSCARIPLCIPLLHHAIVHKQQVFIARGDRDMKRRPPILMSNISSGMLFVMWDVAAEKHLLVWSYVLVV